MAKRGPNQGVAFITVSCNDRDTLRDLERIQRFDIPESRSAAIRRAVDTALGRASTEIAAELGVPRWMIRGVGAKGGSKAAGSRIARTKYVPSLQGVIVRLLQSHINPVGTARRQNKVRTVKRIKGVSVAGRRYPDAFLHPQGYSVFTREGRSLKREIIEIQPNAERTLRRVLATVVPGEFSKRFEHEMKRRMDRRVSKAQRASKRPAANAASTMGT